MPPRADPLPAADKRLILTVTTGRSGTKHLAFCLRLFRSVDARHEPEPKFSGAFRTVLGRPEAAAQFWLERKLPRIARTRKPIYAETSHLACKGFLEPLVELGHRPDLIHLVRDPRAVALSLWRLQTVPGRSYRGQKYYLGPEDPDVLSLSPPPGREPHDYQLCWWYTQEIERRARCYAERFARIGLRMERVAVEDLGDLAGVAELGRRLDLGPLRPMAALALAAFRARHRNRKLEKKLERDLPAERLDELEAEVRSWSGLDEPVPKGEAMDPHQVGDDGELQAALDAPSFLLFKHSPICPVSDRAFREYRAFLELHTDVPTAWLDVVGQRPLSRRVEELTGVRHESPQALVLSRGDVVGHASHGAITREWLEASVEP